MKLTVTIKDCKVEYITCQGNGGQNVNRRHNGVRILHEPSGANGYSCDERKQSQNKELAFVRLVKSKKFDIWARRELSRLQGNLEKTIDREMENIRVEYLTEEGWKHS